MTTPEGPLERNVDRLIRAAALQPDPEQARRRFLRSVTNERPATASRTMASAAAALLIGFVLFWASQPKPPALHPSAPSPAPLVTQDPPAAPLLSPEHPIARPKVAGGDADLGAEVELFTQRRRNHPWVLKGSTRLPERTRLRVALSLRREHLSDDRLVSLLEEGNTSTANVVDGDFVVSSEALFRGPFTFKIDFPEALQRQDVLDQLKGWKGARSWILECAGWGDDLVPALHPGLLALESLLQEAREHLKLFEEALASEERWKVDGPRVLLNGERLQRKIEAKGPGLYPAGWDLLHRTMRDAVGGARLSQWKDGKWTGPVTYHADKEPVKTHRGEPYSLARLKEYLEQAQVVAVREFCLWIIKDVRRGGHRPDHFTAYNGCIRKMSEGHGARFHKLATESLEDLEADLRLLKKGVR